MTLTQLIKQEIINQGGNLEGTNQLQTISKHFMKAYENNHELVFETWFKENKEKFC